MFKVYMLDIQEDVEGKYKKWEKKFVLFGWDGKFYIFCFYCEYCYLRCY